MQESRNSFFRRFEVHANFQHFRSESYAQALQNMSALSPLSFSGSKLESERVFSQHSDYALSASATTLSPSFSRSAPTSPKRLLELQKSSTLPGGTLTGISFPAPKKSNSSSLLSFIKKLSPKTKRSKDKLAEKPWIVVEFSQNEIEGNGCDNISTGSDQSFEMAVKSKENYFESLNSVSRLENSVSDDESLRNNGSKSSLGGGLKSKPSSRSSESSIFTKLSPRKSLQDICSVLKVTGSGSNKHRNTHKVRLHKHRSKEGLSADSCNFKDQMGSNSLSQESTKKSGKIYNAERVNQKKKGSSPGPSVGPSYSPDASSLSMSLQRAQPPQTLSLVSSVFVRKACVDELSKKMASAESIGACSLDVDRSESSLAVGLHEELTASACSLKSASLIMSNGCKGEDEEQKRFRSCAFLYITPDGKAVQMQEETSSVKLPSYLGISCAISGYKNYSRFCHSRDNSPARSVAPSNSHASGPLKPSKDDSDNHVPVEGRDSLYSCSRYHKASYSSQNGTSSSRQTFVSSQEIMIHGTSPGRDAASLMNGSLHNVVSNGHALSNGHGESVVDACETKSLVQQRIESLFGHSNLQVPKMRTSRSATKSIDSSLSARSPSCPPQAIRSHSRSPPVFRHITRDFRDQLQHSSPNEPVLPHVLPRHPFIKCSSQPPESSKQHSASQFHLEAPSMKLVTSGREAAAGHAFLRKIEDEKEKISKHIQEVQKDLANGGIPKPRSNNRVENKWKFFC